MKKIAISAFTIFAITAVVVGGTFAAFQDTAVIEGNTIGTATIDINLEDDAAGYELLEKPIIAENLLPGEETDGYRAVIKNDSTRNVDISMYATRTSGPGTCPDINLFVEYGVADNGVIGTNYDFGPVNGLWGPGNAIPIASNVPPFSEDAVNSRIAIHQIGQLDESATEMGVTCIWDETFVAVPTAS